MQFQPLDSEGWTHVVDWVSSDEEPEEPYDGVTLICMCTLVLIVDDARTCRRACARNVTDHFAIITHRLEPES